MAKYNIVAYTLWLILGFFGAHHFYLGRDHQGLLWLTSFGGLFTLGWVRDFMRIPAYVRESNKDSVYLSNMTREVRRRKRPSVWENFIRIIAQVGFGWFYRGLILYALPEEYAVNTYVVFFLAPLGSAFGTYMVSNVGGIKCHWKYSIVGAYLGELGFGYHHFLLENSYPSLAVTISMLFSTFAWEFDRRPRGQNVVQGGKCCKGTCCKRVVVWTLVFLIYSSLVISFIYFNATITTQEGESIKVREAISNFFKSPYWKLLKKSFWLYTQELWEEYRNKGWEGARKKLMVLADIQGEERSRNVLGVEANSTLDEVKAKYRTLAKEWHPDRHQSSSAEDKARIQEKFIEIQESYEILTKIYKKRESRKVGRR